MGDTGIFATIYVPLITVGLLLMILWAMSTVESYRKGYGQNESERIHSREV